MAPGGYRLGLEGYRLRQSLGVLVEFNYTNRTLPIHLVIVSATCNGLWYASEVYELNRIDSPRVESYRIVSYPNVRHQIPTWPRPVEPEATSSLKNRSNIRRNCLHPQCFMGLVGVRCRLAHRASRMVYSRSFSAMFAQHTLQLSMLGKRPA